MKKVLMAGLLALGMCTASEPVSAHHTPFTPNTPITEIPGGTFVSSGMMFCETIDSLIYELTNINDPISREDCSMRRGLTTFEPELWVDIKQGNKDYVFLIGKTTEDFYIAIERVERDDAA